jgi:cobalt transporter subunit CbtA
MLVRIFATALIAGAIAGVFVFSAHMVKSVPLISQAEVYENTASINDEAASWEPEGGFERNAYTFLADLLISTGFAFVLAGAIALSATEVDWRRGLLWGLSGFFVFHLAPSLGLAPEVPGMHGAEIAARQIWWIGTVISTALGLALMVFSKAGKFAPKIIGGVLIVLPHLIGAPTHEIQQGALPAEIAAEFAVASIIISAMFWVVLGGVSGYFYKRLG